MPHSSGHHKLAALPLHLTLAMLPWLASNAALQRSKDDWPHWNLAQNPSELANLWQRLSLDHALAQATEAEAKNRITQFLEGVLRYQETSYQREKETTPVVYAHGNVRLLDYGGDALGEPVLLIPSLINRYYILDLAPRLSLAHYLAKHGKRVFLVDWGTPGGVENALDCEGYILKHLVPMTEVVQQVTAKHVTAIGYCMGGLLALGLTVARPDLVCSLACLATPWDFSVPEFPKNPILGSTLESLGPFLSSKGLLPEEFIQMLFHLAQPYAFQKKMRDFQAMRSGGQDIKDFLAIERWVQDGVPMTRGVAEDCLIHWMQNNMTARLQWKVKGKIVNPASLSIPLFVAAPKDDRIVPSACALPLAIGAQRLTLIEPASGHVGMVVGKRRKMALWEPLLAWINSQVT